MAEVQLEAAGAELAETLYVQVEQSLSGAARRTLRTNLRFIGGRVVPHL